MKTYAKLNGILRIESVNVLRKGSIASCDKMLSVKDPLLLEIKKHEKYQICVMDLVSHRGITLMLFGMYAIQPVC